MPDRRRPSGIQFPNKNYSDSSDDSDQMASCLGRCFNYVHTCCENPILLGTGKGFIPLPSRKMKTTELEILTH